MLSKIRGAIRSRSPAKKALSDEAEKPEEKKKSVSFSPATDDDPTALEISISVAK
jgi:hypothetical protein